jgi:hypothetical protein
MMGLGHYGNGWIILWRELTWLDMDLLWLEYGATHLWLLFHFDLIILLI